MTSNICSMNEYHMFIGIQVEPNCADDKIFNNYKEKIVYIFRKRFDLISLISASTRKSSVVLRKSVFIVVNFFFATKSKTLEKVGDRLDWSSLNVEYGATTPERE